MVQFSDSGYVHGDNNDNNNDGRFTGSFNGHLVNLQPCLDLILGVGVHVVERVNNVSVCGWCVYNPTAQYNDVVQPSVADLLAGLLGTEHGSSQSRQPGIQLADRQNVL